MRFRHHWKRTSCVWSSHCLEKSRPLRNPSSVFLVPPPPSSPHKFNINYKHVDCKPRWNRACVDSTGLESRHIFRTIPAYSNNRPCRNKQLRILSKTSFVSYNTLRNNHISLSGNKQRPCSTGPGQTPLTCGGKSSNYFHRSAYKIFGKAV